MSLSPSTSALIATLLALVNGCATGTGARHDVGATGQLREAMVAGRAPVVARLLAHGVDPTVADADGFTALHATADRGQAPVVEVRLAQGARVRALLDARVHDGRTSPDPLRSRHDRSRLEVLRSAAAGPQPESASAAGSDWEQHMEAGNRAYAAGRHDEAQTAWRLALNEAQRFGSDDPRLFPPLQSLGKLALTQGRDAEAEPLLRRALDLRQKLLGPEDRDVAESLIELGVSLYRQGKYEEAERLVLRANAIREKVLGPDHPETAQSLTDLSEIYWAQARYPEAERLLRRVLASRETTLGPEHRDVAGSLNDLAVVLTARGQYPEAERLLRRAIEIREQVLGRQHADVSTSLGNLATLYQFQRRDAEAEALYRQALTIDENTFGPDDPRVATTLNNLAMLVRAQGRYGEAEPLLQRAVAIREKTLGSDHPLLAQDFNNLAVLYLDQGRDTEAESLLQRALGIRETSLVPDHPDVAHSLANLGGHYLREGRYAEAESLLQRALTIDEKALGPDHPTLAQNLAELARVRRAQGRGEEAETLQRRALAIRETRLGAEHPDVVGSLYALAETTLALGKSSETDALIRRAGEIQRARGETLGVVMLKALATDHVDRPDPGRLAQAALDDVRRRLSSLGIQDRLAEPTGTDADVTAEFRRGIARAVELAQGRVSAEDLERTAADAMVRSLQDPHTRLLSPDEARRHALQMMGRPSYVGIGVLLVTRQGHHYVWHVQPDGPADRAGLKAFDRVLAIDGDRIEGVPVQEIGRRLGGLEGTLVRLTVQRPGEPQPRLVLVGRGLVPVHPVEHRVVPPGIGYIRLADFAGGTGRAMRRVLEDLQSQGLRGLVLDLRENPGGSFSELARMAEMLLPRGSTVRETQTGYGRSAQVTRDDALLAASIPVAVLVNERTASAAEVLVAAIQSAGRGVLVGTRTAGAVGVKSMVWLPNGAGLLVRTARVMSPRGVDLDGNGVAPDVTQELTREDLDRGRDSQVLRAIAAVSRHRRGAARYPCQVARL